MTYLIAAPSDETTAANSKVALSRALQLLDIFRDLDKEVDMPMGEAVSLLLIALGESKDGGGLSVTNLARVGEFAMSSASRYQQNLGMKKDRHDRPGKKVVEVVRPDERSKILRLSPKGKRTVEQITKLLGD